MKVIPAFGDTALAVGLAGLVALWREPKVWANVASPPEAARVIDGGQESQCGDWTDAGHGHEPAQRRVGAHDAPDLAIELTIWVAT